MNECKHGLRTGCSYCHVASPGASRPTPTRSTPTPRRRGSSPALSEKMNDRMLQLKKRLKEIRGDQPAD
jgi:hypothetical protein